MSDTPRTDDESFFMHHSRYDFCKADLARQLERELNAANNKIKRLEDAGDALKAAGYFGGWADAVNKWIKAKESKP